MKQVGLIILALIVWVTPSSVFAAAADQILADMIGPDNGATNFMPVISTCNNLDANPASIFTTAISYATPVNQDAKLTRYQMVVSDIDSVGMPTHYDQATYTFRIWNDPQDAVSNLNNGTIADCEIVYSEHITQITHFGERELVPMWNIPTSLLTLDLRHCNITLPNNSAFVIGVHAEIFGDEWGRVMYSQSNINYGLPVFIADHTSGTMAPTSEVGARLFGRKIKSLPCDNTHFGSTCDR